MTTTLPILASVGRAYTMLWRERGLHAKAIWPPVLFLVTAEFLYHRMVGNAEGVAGHLHALLAAPWYMLLGAIAAWLAGLKFLLSFSISWRRHLLLGERFDPFFFHAPFWRYLGFLLLTYAWIVPLALASLLPSLLLASAHAPKIVIGASFLAVPVAVALAIWGVVRQVPFFTALTFDRPQAPWRACTRAMRGHVRHYLAIFALAMLPVAALNLALDELLKLVHANRHAIHVALAESAVRQAMLFVHFALGAAVGAITTASVLDGVPPPRTR